MEVTRLKPPPFRTRSLLPQEVAVRTNKLQAKRVSFEIDASQLTYHNRNIILDVKEGPYEFRVGHSVTDVASTADFEVTDTKEVLESGRTYFTETEVENAE